jgi:hypothetical protein
MTDDWLQQSRHTSAHRRVSGHKITHDTGAAAAPTPTIVIIASNHLVSGAAGRLLLSDK